MDLSLSTVSITKFSLQSGSWVCGCVHTTTKWYCINRAASRVEALPGSTVCHVVHVVEPGTVEAALLFTKLNQLELDFDRRFYDNAMRSYRYTVPVYWMYSDDTQCPTKRGSKKRGARQSGKFCPLTRFVIIIGPETNCRSTQSIDSRGMYNTIHIHHT